MSAHADIFYCSTLYKSVPAGLWNAFSPYSGNMAYMYSKISACRCSYATHAVLLEKKYSSNGNPWAVG